MKREEIVSKVHRYYWDMDFNCATIMLKILAEVYNIELEQQILDSVIGMHGAGKYRAQCGLVEGMLMFIGIYGRKLNYSEKRIIDLCYNSAAGFEEQFGSLSCRELRPEGFRADNPPHLCEELSVDAVNYAMDFIAKF